MFLELETAQDLSSTEKELRDKQLNATAEQDFEYLRNGTLGYR